MLSGLGAPVALRIDDIGASSKKYEVYSDRFWQIGPVRLSGNWLFLKYLRPFRKWGPYREMSVVDWEHILRLLEQYGAKLTVAITAAWAEAEDKLIPFPVRFPGQAGLIRDGVSRGWIEVANHGLSHCVLEGNVFKPKLVTGNREFHREFVDSVSAEIQEQHIRLSQEILEEWFECEIVTFVPPGNAFSEITLEIARKHRLRLLSCNTTSKPNGALTIIGNEYTRAFHDRDLVMNGIGWFEELLAQTDGHTAFVRDLPEMIKAL